MSYTNFIIKMLCLGLIIATITAQDTCSPTDQQFLVTFHPHLDAFWLNTDDQLKDINFRPAGFLYAMNQRNSKTIFNSMFEALKANPTRKYFVTEIVFLKDWYETLDSTKKKTIKTFIESGQLEITNGGWVQNDEAVCYIDDIIDQYTIGHNFLYQEFDQQTKIGWATDSFGHSHSQAAIQHILGLQAQGIERIDDRYIYQRKEKSLLEFYWSAVSDSNNKKYGGVFTYVRHFLHQYVDYRSENPNRLAGDYEQVKTIMKKLFRKQKLFRFVGNDFQQFIPQQFDVLESTIKLLNSKQQKQCPVFKYGNPTDYFKMIKDNKDEEIPVRQGDFMPNYDQDHYWSGYYTTNPLLKVVCKDFSRLVNLYRKIYIKDRIKNQNENQNHKNLLTRADQLLAVNQHHDGITATSKYHIQELMKSRMLNTSEQIIKAITQIANMPSKRCNAFGQADKCVLNGFDNQKVIYLTLVHQGAPKTQRVEISLAQGQFYQAQEASQDAIFCFGAGICTLVFDAPLQSGNNVFKLNKIENTRSDIIFNWNNDVGTTFSTNHFTIENQGSKIKYTLKNGDYIHLSLVKSPTGISSVQTLTWNKYGEPIRKNERRVAGIYIMANNGKLEEIIQGKFQSLRVAQSKRYVKFAVSCQLGELSFTIVKQDMNQIEATINFKPLNWQMFDYFVKIDSTVKSNGVFYHDMNGYLVSKRKVGERLDYEWNYRPQDKINANTYPMCSFAYAIEGNKKIVVFTDRAQGVTLYDNSLLVNIDRLAGDDYKGVGEGYNKQLINIFKFKIAYLHKDDHSQRIWQKQYDEMNLAYLSTTPISQKSSKNPTTVDQQNPIWLKYTMFSLNKDQFVIRLYNMNQDKQIQFNRYKSNKWVIEEIGLDLQFQDIKQSFANGFPLAQRKVWKKINDEINIFNAGSKDTEEKLVLQPLQIRSFRINLSKKIVQKNGAKQAEQPLSNVVVSKAAPLKAHFHRRCF